MLVRETPAAELIRLARTRAGLTQAELASRVGTTQSVISAYESGHREPAFSTLVALVEGTGHGLHIDLKPGRRPTQLSGPLGHRLRRLRGRVIRASARHGATNLRVFGSVARGDEQPDSDIDLLVDLSPNVGLLALMRLERDLETILDARVDLVPADGIKPNLRPEVEWDSVPL